MQSVSHAHAINFTCFNNDCKNVATITCDKCQFVCYCSLNCLLNDQKQHKILCSHLQQHPNIAIVMKKAMCIKFNLYVVNSEDDRLEITKAREAYCVALRSFAHLLYLTVNENVTKEKLSEFDFDVEMSRLHQDSIDVRKQLEVSENNICLLQ